MTACAAEQDAPAILTGISLSRLRLVDWGDFVFAVTGSRFRDCSSQPVTAVSEQPGANDRLHLEYLRAAASG